MGETRKAAQTWECGSKQDRCKAKGIAKGGCEWIRAPLNENLVIVNLLYPPFLHSSQVTHLLHSENTVCIANTILIKRLIQIPPNSIGKNKEIVTASQKVKQGPLSECREYIQLLYFLT